MSFRALENIFLMFICEFFVQFCLWYSKLLIIWNTSSHVDILKYFVKVSSRLVDISDGSVLN